MKHKVPSVLKLVRRELERVMYERQRKYAVYRINDRIYHIYLVKDLIGNICSALRVSAGTQTPDGSMAAEYYTRLLLNDTWQNHHIAQSDDHYSTQIINAHYRHYGTPPRYAHSLRLLRE